jgi:predicted amidohydrolase
LNVITGIGQIERQEMDMVRIGSSQMYISDNVRNNAVAIIENMHEAARRNVELLIFPEMSLTGFNLRTLAQPDFKDDLSASFEEIASRVEELGVGVIIGHASFRQNKMLNSATVLLPGGVKYRYDKTNLTEAEKEYFLPGNDLLKFTYKDYKFGVIICRDQNYPELAYNICCSGSALFILAAHYYRPAEARSKLDKNRALPIARAVENSCYVIVSNTIGSHIGMNSLGNSLIVNPEGVVIAQADEFSPVMLTCDM